VEEAIAVAGREHYEHWYKSTCEVSGQILSDHNKMVELGSGRQREVDDIRLTRYACYLIAQNGDPRKQEITFTQEPSNLHG
jgi:DNA-damage-inducible protein D